MTSRFSRTIAARAALTIFVSLLLLVGLNGVAPRSSLVLSGPSPRCLDLGTRLLAGQAPLDGPAGRLARPPLRRRRSQCRLEELRQPPSGLFPITELGPLLRDGNDDRSVDQLAMQPLHQPLAQVSRQCGHTGRVVRSPTQLDPTVGRVDPLTAGTRRPGEPPSQLVDGDAEPVGHPQRYIDAMGPRCRCAGTLRSLHGAHLRRGHRTRSGATAQNQ